MWGKHKNKMFTNTALCLWHLLGFLLGWTKRGSVSGCGGSIGDSSHSLSNSGYQHQHQHQLKLFTWRPSCSTPWRIDSCIRLWEEAGPCHSYFSVIAIRHTTKGTYTKCLFGGSRFQGVRVYDGHDQEYGSMQAERTLEQMLRVSHLET